MAAAVPQYVPNEFSKNELAINHPPPTSIPTSPSNLSKDQALLKLWGYLEEKSLTINRVPLPPDRLHAWSIIDATILDPKRVIAARHPALGQDSRYLWKFLTTEERESNMAILDLTNDNDFLEGDLSPYYPEEVEKPKIYKDLSVVHESKTMNSPGINEYVYIIFKDLKRIKTVTRYHCDFWIDGTAVSIKKLNQIAELIDRHRGGIYIHCREGVGRTGTATLAYIMKKQVERGLLTGASKLTDFAQIILEARKRRSSPFFVHTYPQFLSLIDYAEKLLASQIKEIPSLATTQEEVEEQDTISTANISLHTVP